ncbi:MAG: DUF1062 domain-containing protein [Tabrizicola sp.]|jgi:hypothetical protein|nr:DUF1062 domain-containing protein [Tabrizicola sp.]
MTGILSCLWHIEPLCPPEPWHPCAHCGTPRAFRPTGKVRLNANGRRLDAWLIYNCTRCAATWNLPLVDRVPVAAIAPADLQAMTHSDPYWVRRHLFDLASLKRHATRIDQPSGVRARCTPALPLDWSDLSVTLCVPHPVGDRLDRCLSGFLGLSRSGVATLCRTGGLSLLSGALNRPIRHGTSLHLKADALITDQRNSLATALSLET